MIILAAHFRMMMAEEVCVKAQKRGCSKRISTYGASSDVFDAFD